MPAEQVFKTLPHSPMASSDFVFAVIPGDAELDFKKLARAAGWRKAEMAPLKDVQPLTGYIRGGVTIFGAKKPYPVFVDETAILFDKISVSAGTRGTQLILTPDDYLRAAAALDAPVKTADLTKDTRAKAPQRSDRAEAMRLLTNLRRHANDPRSLDASRQRSPHRVAHARRHDLHAVLLGPGGRALLHRLRSARRVLAANRRRRALRGHHVRVGQRAQPGLGARNPSPGHGRAAHGPLARSGALPGQGHRQLPLRHHRADHPGALLCHLLQPAHRGQRLAARAGAAAGHMGAGRATASSLPRSP